MKKRILILALTVLTVFAFTACKGKEPEVPEVEYIKADNVTIFGNGDTTISMSYQIYGDKAQEAATEIVRRLRELNQHAIADLDPKYNEINDDNYIYHFNNTIEANQWFEVSKPIYELVAMSREVYDISGGYFDPTVYPLLDLWDLRGSFMAWLHIPSRTDFTFPTLQQIDDMLEYCSMELIEFKEGQGVAAQNDELGKYYLLKKDKRTQLELGAIAKGYGADICREVSEKYGVRSALYNLSGNIYLYQNKLVYENQMTVDQNGKDVDNWVMVEQPWQVYVSEPRAKKGLPGFVGMELAHTSTVVSGDYNLYYNYKGTETGNVSLRVPHIINPKTGMPLNIHYNTEKDQYYQAADGLISTGIIGVNSALCDAYSTAAIVMGMDAAIAMMEPLEKAGQFRSVLISESHYAILGEFEYYDVNGLLKGYTNYQWYYGSRPPQN